MANPLRVQKGEAGYDVSITRPGPWGNPFVIGVHGTRAEVIAKYAEWLPKQPELMARLPELRGKVLGCACRADQKCHGDTILRLIDELDKPACSRCQGIGEIRNEIFMDDQYDEMMECPHCEGKGWSVEPFPAPYPSKCPECRESGR